MSCEVNFGVCFVLIDMDPYLPPVGVLGAENLQDVAVSEGKPGLLTRDEAISQGVVVEVGLHVHLEGGHTWYLVNHRSLRGDIHGT
jgi:hypothetical protein